MHSKMKRMITRMKEKEKTAKKRSKEKWFLYILQCVDGSLYTGITHDLDSRVEMHSKGRGAKYTRSRLPLAMVYSEKCRNRVAAMVRECAIKGLSRAEKDKLISSFVN